MVFDERRVHVSRRGRGVNADGQEAKFAAASAFDPPELRVHAIEDSRGARDELPTHRGKVGAALRPFEQDHVKLALDLVQPAAQGGLAYVQGFRRLSQAAVLGRHDSQSQITKLYIHMTHFIGLDGPPFTNFAPCCVPLRDRLYLNERGKSLVSKQCVRPAADRCRDRARPGSPNRRKSGRVAVPWSRGRLRSWRDFPALRWRSGRIC